MTMNYDYAMQVDGMIDRDDELPPFATEPNPKAEPKDLRELVNHYRLLSVDDVSGLRWLIEQAIQRDDSLPGLARTWVRIEACKPLMSAYVYQFACELALKKMASIKRRLERESAVLVRPQPARREYYGGIDI
jgi:hypothetical protein